MRGKKAQASFDYMSTFVLAGIGIALAMGAITYFDLFETTKLVKDGCTLVGQLNCVDVIVRPNGDIAIMYENKYNRNITVIATRITHEGITQTDSTSFTFEEKTETVLTQNFAALNGAEIGEKEQFDFEIDYRLPGSTITHTTRATAVATVSS